MSLLGHSYPGPVALLTFALGVNHLEVTFIMCNIRYTCIFMSIQICITFLRRVLISLEVALFGTKFRNLIYSRYMVFGINLSFKRTKNYIDSYT